MAASGHTLSTATSGAAGKIGAAIFQPAICNRRRPGYRAAMSRRQEIQHPQGHPLRQAAARLSRPEAGRRRTAGQAGARQPCPPARTRHRDGLVRLYGIHTVRAALDNPARKIRRMLVTRNAAGAARHRRSRRPALHGRAGRAARRSTSITGSDAVHQGVAIEAEPLQAQAARRARRHQAGAGARPGHRSAQCRRDHALGRRLRRRRADHHASATARRNPACSPSRPRARWSTST